MANNLITRVLVGDIEQRNPREHEAETTLALTKPGDPGRHQKLEEAQKDSFPDSVEGL